MSFSDEDERQIVPHRNEPVREFEGNLGEVVSEALGSQGYCLIPMPLSEEDREALLDSVKDEERSFFRFPQEVEVGYMGFESHTKVAWLPLRQGGDGYDDEEQGVIGDCDRKLTDIATKVGSYAPRTTGITCDGRMAGLLRMTMTRNDEDDLQPESLRDIAQDSDGNWTGPLQEYLLFIRRRKLCLLWILSGEHGDIWFYPKDGSSYFREPVSQDTLVVFRHDNFDYSLQLRGHIVVLQTWILQNTGKFQTAKEMQANLGDHVTGELGEVVLNPGPAVPDGPKASIMSLTTRLPGECWTPGGYWLMFASGSDSCSQWPAARWETDLYYEQGADSIATGKSYTCHGGFVSQDQIALFDNEFFGIEHNEARSMVPGQRISLETGYQCLQAAGFDRKSLKGRRVGVWFGDVGPDWHSFQTEWARFCWDICPTIMATSMNNAATAARISHIFDLRGPVSSYDTACSASLVAMNAAHLCMFDQDPPRKDNSEALVVGVNTLLGPASFIGNCMATMLSHQGRSFTFNRSADGYQRGEGAGAVFVRLFQGDARDEEERVAALIGTATNQDGRSASLTAPNGPAQQAVIRKSMRFAGINPNTVSIAECHGTGTALGDPIEVGALMAVMHERKVPILKTSAKSNIAHLEAGAGIAGLTKCIMMINMATAPPNCHFNIINPHLTIEGYPVYFDSEDIDVGMSSLYCGVSSFGFGGTNSRADVYGHASKGHRSSLKVTLPPPSMPKVMHIGQPVFVSGSWDNFSTWKAMEGGRYGDYACAIAVGDNGQVEFQLSCTHSGEEAIHPVVPGADQGAQIIGPDWGGKGLNFLIDAATDGLPAGTVYEVNFRWSDEGKSISWQPLNRESSLQVFGLPPPQPIANGNLEADDE